MRKEALHVASPSLFLGIAASLACAAPIESTRVLAVYVADDGPVFQLDEALDETDRLIVTAEGVVDLFNPDPGLRFNAAGVLLADSTAVGGLSTGDVLPIPPNDTRPLVQGGLNGALLLGNAELGYIPLFDANGDSGLGSDSPPTRLVVERSVADAFGDAISAGTSLGLRINDVNNHDNTGQFFVRLDVNTQPAAIPYSYRFVQRTGDVVDGEMIAGVADAVVSTHGDVAYRAIFENGREAILKQSGGQTATLADNHGAMIADIGTGLGINAAGQVAFMALLPSGEQAVYRADARGLTPIVASGPAIREIEYHVNGPGSSGPAINEAGEVAFRVEYLDRLEAILVGDGDLWREAVLTESTDDSIGLRPSINDAGQILYFSTRDGLPTQLLIRDGGNDVMVAETQSPSNPDGFFGFGGSFDVNSPMIDNTGRAGFIARPADRDGDEIHVYENGELTLLVSTKGTAFTNLGSPIFNDAGDVVFAGFFQDFAPGLNGIFTGPDPIYDRIVRTDDIVDGMAVRRASVQRDGLNNSGDVVFVAELADGLGTAVVLAERQAPTLFYSLETGEMFVDRDGLDDVSALAFESESGVFTGELDTSFDAVAVQQTQNRIEMILTDSSLPTGMQSLGYLAAEDIQLDALVDDLTMIGRRRDWPQFAIELQLLPPPTSGDFDYNGIVDGRDFLKWQSGRLASPLSAADLAEWSANFGSTTNLASFEHAIPEPTSVILTLISAALLWQRASSRQ